MLDKGYSVTFVIWSNQLNTSNGKEEIMFIIRNIYFSVNCYVSPDKVSSSNIGFNQEMDMRRICDAFLEKKIHLPKTSQILESGGGREPIYLM